MVVLRASSLSKLQHKEGDTTLASCEKYTHEAVCSQSAHVSREHANPANPDIDRQRTHLNYSFPMDHHGLSPFAYYKKRIKETYLYGRGSKREKDAVTGVGWIVSLPKELIGNEEKERAFFQATYNFISDRYGPENIINNAVHMDESGVPHIHVLFAPITKINHDVIQYKTVKTTHAERLPSGRYEYTYRFRQDDNGARIKLKNYARISDYYDEKIDANSVLNKMELRNFHPDLQKYLSDHGIEGKVCTGKTGTNFTVKELKSFTKATGIHLDDIKESIGEKSILEGIVDRDIKISALEEKITELEKSIEQKNIALQQAQDAIRSYEKKIEIQHSNPNLNWGTYSSWESKGHSGWGTSDKKNDIEEQW